MIYYFCLSVHGECTVTFSVFLILHLCFNTTKSFFFTFHLSLTVSLQCVPCSHPVCCLAGRTPVTARRPRPSCPPKPADLPQRPRAPAAAEGSSWLSAVRQQVLRRHPVIPSTVRLPPGVSLSAATASSSALSRHARSLTVVQRREHPGRRKDSIQSLYIAPGNDLSTTPPSPSSASLQSPTSTKVKRRFSDPDIPYIDDYSPAGKAE